MNLLGKFFSKKRIRLWLAFWLDIFIPIRKDRVVFVTRKNVPISGNLRIVADVLADHGQHNIGIFKDGSIPENTIQALQSKGIVVFAGFSFSALRFILSSKTVFLSHSARDAFLTRRRLGRRVINLWHGVALKRIELMMKPSTDVIKYETRQKLIRKNAKIYDAMIASSPVDRLVNSCAFGVAFDKVHVTGLPRFDYLDCAYHLPSDLEIQAKELDLILGDRQLILYAPTFREAGQSVFHYMDEKCLHQLRCLCEEKNLVLGIRPHPYEACSLKKICDGQHILDLSSINFSEPALLLNRAKILIVDYSSIWVDYLVLKRPILGFLPDFENYSQHDRGFIYSHESIFPGLIKKSWDEIIFEVEKVVAQNFQLVNSERYVATSAWLLPPASEDSSCANACIELFFSEIKPKNKTPDQMKFEPSIKEIV